jgi:hypothetical protein
MNRTPKLNEPLYLKPPPPPPVPSQYQPLFPPPPPSSAAFNPMMAAAMFYHQQRAAAAYGFGAFAGAQFGLPPTAPMKTHTANSTGVAMLDTSSDAGSSTSPVDYRHK